MKRFNFIMAVLVLLTAACNLTQEVDIDLPEYERQPVVECYLEPGQPFRLLLTKSYGFFDPFGLDSTFLQKTVLDGATVTVSYNGQTDTLHNQLSFTLNPTKIFNYRGDNLVPADPGVEYVLNIELPNGEGQITGRTVMLPLVPFDSIKVQRSATNDTLYRVLAYFHDDPSTANWYRRLLNYSSLDSFPDQDFILDDKLSTNGQFAFGTQYELTRGDTVFNTLFHINQDYYDYVESVQLAVFGNLNPFAQPSPIKSNVSGTGNPLGIFTCLVYDRDTLIVE
jgi:hypothetical protein